MVAIWSGLGVIKTGKSLSLALLLAGLGVVGLALSGCAEGPGYGYRPGYYGSAAVGYGSVFAPYGYAEPYGYGPGPVYYRHHADDDDRDFHRDHDVDHHEDHDHDDDDHDHDRR